MSKSILEGLMLLQIRAAGLPMPEREYRFHPTRKWRWDCAWPLQKLALEIMGGTRNNGRHSRHEGYQADCDKANAGVLLGWRLLRVTGEQVNNGSALEVLKEALNAG